MWIDSHCHITADAFREDRSEVLERASEAGVETVIAIAAWIYGRWNTPARRSGVRWTARGLLARGSWPQLPALAGVVECPVLRADGSVLQAAGDHGGRCTIRRSASRPNRNPPKQQTRQLCSK